MTLTTGQLLAQRYLLGRRIAVGGMGEVWEAEDTRLDRQVAVKVLRPELSGDAEFRDRFHTEARMAASLNHPGIAGVHDYGETATAGSAGTAYLVMELVAGDSLAAILQRHSRLATDRTLGILRQAGDALQAAHERGLVHRDVKPGNILITPTGQVKLTDFGVAKAVNTAPVTRQGIVMGTAHYIAPEQAAGDPAGPASDVYALGVVGYECLAGRRPFLSDNALTVAMMHIRAAAPPLPPEIPPGTRALIDAALAKDPRQRYGTGGEFAAAVTAVQAGQPPPAPVQLAGTTAHSNHQPGHPLPQTALLAAGSLSGPSTGQYPGSYPPPHYPTQLNPAQSYSPQPYSPQLYSPQPYSPQRSTRRRGTVGITVAVLAVLGLVLGVLGVRQALLRSADMTPQAGTGVPPAEPVLPSSVQERETTAAEPSDEESTTEPPAPLDPENILIIVTDYLLRSGSDAASIAAERGLEPLVVDEDGDEIDPEDQTKCLVTRVDPIAGWVSAGSLLELTCEEVS